MTQLKEIAGDQPIVGYFPGQSTAGTPKENALFRAPFRCVITAVDFIPSAAITGQATNFFTLNVRNRAAGAGAAVPATLAFSSAPVAGVAQTPLSIALSATATDLVLAAGDVVTAEKAVTGTGLACPDGAIVVHVKAA